MTTNAPQNEIRELSVDELDAAAGGAIHIHVKGVFHLAIGGGEISVGVLGVGVGIDGDGPFTFEFDN